jgi:RsmE family RNA methyltransferase
MRHVPHLYLPGPWEDDEIEVPGPARRHLATVLRYESGSQVTYTDGAGGVGDGTWMGDSVRRGPERDVQRRSPYLTIAVAPPKPKERQRFIVEKLQELEVDELVWLATAYGQARPPSHERSRAWAIAALEQSRGAYLIGCANGTLADLDRPIAALPGGSAPGDLLPLPGPVTVAIGPEGGFTDVEVEACPRSLSLGRTVLRTETAAIAAGMLVRAADCR